MILTFEYAKHESRYLLTLKIYKWDDLYVLLRTIKLTGVKRAKKTVHLLKELVDRLNEIKVECTVGRKNTMNLSKVRINYFYSLQRDVIGIWYNS